MAEVSLYPNPAQSASLRITVSRRVRKWFCHPEAFLSLAGATVPAIDILGSYKYLGIHRGAGQKVGGAVTSKLEEGLKQLYKAPLKPEQRLFFLCVHVLPGLYHETALNKFSKSLLKNLDRKASASARWLHLPHDVPGTVPCISQRGRPWIARVTGADSAHEASEGKEALSASDERS